MSDCSGCAAMAAQVAALQQQVAALGAQVEFLQQQVGAALAGVRGAVALIEKEMDEPSMSRRDLIQALDQRLRYLLEVVEGRRV
ncbi:hypothetical protein ABN028_34005 [Actinopolymorpha sp. B17G11]|uniref:hypothetical protein n=1 Tax=Actinopolymorpha sp. B17G11 TaxID=3160861 RepID=UPI0032E4D9E1